jgi:hypothetical protein
MTDELETGTIDEEHSGARGENAADAEVKVWKVWDLPGLIAIGLYLLAISLVVIVGVVSGRYPALFLVFPVLFFAASAGLVMMFRWAWALALGAVLLMAVFNMWIFTSRHESPALVQGLLNWVFFLYLIRTEVRTKLR